MVTRRHRCYVIAEAGVNHNGSFELAMRLVDAAAEAGVDAVKFQTFNADKLASALAPMAEYQIRNAGEFNSQAEMLRGLELTRPMHAPLAERCRELGIAFLSTPFDEDSLSFLATEIEVPAIKISSGDLTHAPLLLSAARAGLPLLLSTGMSSLADIEEALGVIALGLVKPNGLPTRAAFRQAYASAEGRDALKRSVTLLHCVTAYPAPEASVNLRAMDTLSNAFQLPVGYSDHTMGSAIALAAVARGATVLEKHLTLDRTLPGPDHSASLNPDEFKTLVRELRLVESALGSGLKVPDPVEFANIPVARRSLVTISLVRAGELFSASNLGVRRPGIGAPPIEYWERLGTNASRDYGPGETVDP